MPVDKNVRIATTGSAARIPRTGSENSEARTASPARPWPASLRRRFRRGEEDEGTVFRLIAPLGVPIMLLALIVVFATQSPTFLTSGNFKDILATAALPAMVAVGLTICLVMGEYDLSIAATASFATMLFSVLVVKGGVDPWTAITLTMLSGIGVGLLNGVMVAYIGVTALVATIAVGSVLNGAEFFISGNTQIYGGYPEGFVKFARGETGPVANLVIIATIVITFFWVLLEKTTLGRHMRAVGGNSEAALLAGVNVRKTRAIGFALCASAAAFAGVLFAGRQAVAYPLAGLNVLLPSFAAAFIGAAVFRLGEFNVLGTVVGVLVATIAASGLILLNVPAYASYIFQGTILLVALIFARMVSRGREQ